jgi:hypothetical protein
VLKRLIVRKAAMLQGGLQGCLWGGGQDRPDRARPGRPRRERPRAAGDPRVIGGMLHREGGGPRRFFVKGGVALWVSTPITTFMSARTSVSIGYSPSARAKDIPTLGAAPTPLLSHSAPGTGGTQAQNKPIQLVGDRKFAGDP